MASTPQGASGTPCPHVAECDLCPWAGIPLAKQRERERADLVDALAALVPDASAASRVAPLVPCGEWGTDNAFSYVTFGATKRFEAGLPKRGSAHPLQVEQCARFHAQGRELPASLRQALRYLEHRGRHFMDRATVRHSETTGETEVAIWTRPGHFPSAAVGEAIHHRTGATSVVRVTYEGALDAPTSLGLEALYGEGYWIEEVRGEAFMVLANVPFPVNTGGAEKMIGFVLDALQPEDGMRIAVLGANVGLVALPLARGGARVTAVEQDAVAAACLRANLEHAEASCDIVTDADGLAAMAARRDAAPAAAFDAVVLDALDKAVDPRSVAMAAKLHPHAIAHVATDATEDAKALAPLLDAGYDLDAVTPFDLAPHTPRLAAVALFVRR